MKAIVTLAKDHSDIVMISKNNPESAAIMLRNDVVSLNSAGFLQTEKRVGLLKGKTEEIRALAAGLKPGDDFSAKRFPVKLVIQESNTPFFDGQTPKINPSTAEIVTSNGSPVYRQTVVVPESMEISDTLLVTDKEPVTAKMEANKSFHEANK